jgi:RNA polymerase sigma-70 factor (ECF subfamily)
VGHIDPVVPVVDLSEATIQTVRGNGDDVMRDEVPGPAVPAPGQAQRAVSEAGDSVGEGGSVRIAVRDTGAAEVPEDRAQVTDGATPVAGMTDAAVVADGAAARGGPADEPTTVSEVVSEVVSDVARTPVDTEAADPGTTETAAEPAVDLPTAGGAGEETAADGAAADPAPSLPTAVGSADPAEVTGSYVVQDAPTEMSPSELRVDFGAHLEANYQRLVAQLYAITLSADQAHSLVQDAYSRAWRNWAVIGRSTDPTGWVRRVAVRTTMRSWRHVLARIGLVRSTPPVAEGLDERTTALLVALRELSAPERRSVVLFHMAGLSTGEIAAVEQVSPNTIGTRLDRARRAVLGNDADLMSGFVDLAVPADDRGYIEEMTLPAGEAPGGIAGHLDDRWERVGTWNGGPDGSWPVSEAPPWEAPNSDPWPEADVRRLGAEGDAQRTGRGPRNDLTEGPDEWAWNRAPSRETPLFDEFDEFDTVAPDGTVVVGADVAPDRDRIGSLDERAVAGDRDGDRRGDRDGAAHDGADVGDARVGHGTEGDSEDRR